MKSLIFALALGLPCTAIAAELTQSQVAVARELPNYGFKDVDVTTLSSAQLQQIRHLLYSNQTTAQIRGNIGAILGDSLLNTILGQGTRG